MFDTEVDLLIEGCRKEDRKAQRSLYNRYYSVLMNLCMRYGKDKGEAEQLVHDSFLKVFTRIDDYRNEGSFEGWMKRICVNTCLDNYKKRNTFAGSIQVATNYNGDIEKYANDFVSNDVFEKLSVDAILNIIEKLPEKERIVFKLHALDGYPHDEISTMVGITSNHSYWLLHNARKLMRTYINKSASR